MIIAPRWPWPPHSGDRARANLWVEALRGRAEVVVVTPRRDDAGEPGVRVIGARLSVAALLAGVARALRDRLPLHTLAAAPYAWAAAIREAGPVDCAVVLLSRLHPWVYRSLGAKRRLLDAIDSASAGMAERAAAARNPLARLFWRREARAMTRLEREAGTKYDRVILVSAAEEHAFGERATTVAMGVDVGDAPGTHVRPYDCGFWGRLAYFANSRAAEALVRDIWPEIRRRRPEATLFIGGADAPEWLRRYDGRDGITVRSPAGDRGAALRAVRVILLPVLYGTGVSLKTAEAAEAGCAIVGTPMAFRGAPDLGAAAIVEPDLGRFAERAVSLLEHTAAARAAGDALRAIAVSGHSRDRIRERLAAIALEGLD